MMKIYYTPEPVKPYNGPDPNLEYPGENDLVWCPRCRTHHRKGPPWPIAEQRIVNKMVDQLVKEIDTELIEQLKQEAAK